ncbi:MAG: IS630 transposase-related protein [Alphaproteobacteria bacterium]|jgi:transposase
MSYDKKFRLQVLKVREEKGLSLVETGKLFGIHKQTIYNWSKRLEEKKRERKAFKLDMASLAQDVANHPEAYQHERASRFNVSPRCIGYGLKRLGITVKKKPQASQSGSRQTVYILPTN